MSKTEGKPKMAVNSINSNVGAMVALQNLNETSRALEVTQNRVNTGKSVSSAKDNGAIFAIATGMRADMGSLNSVRNSIERGKSVIDVALAAGDTISKALEEQKSLAVAIQSVPETSASATAYLADYNALGVEITAALNAATFDGVNLFLVSSPANSLVVQTGLTSTQIVHSNVAGATPATTLSDVTGTKLYAAATVANVNSAMTAFNTKMAAIGSASKSLDRQATFVSKLQDALESGVGNLVDADLAKESARLTALQTKQQLGVQALGIANQSSSILLGLFR
jgi:flagellin